MVKSLANAAGFNATVRAASGGQFLSNHLSSSYVRSIITEGEWDAIVLQGHSVRSGVHYGYVRVAELTMYLDNLRFRSTITYYLRLQPLWKS